MDLLASLGLENALPEQSTRLVHPGVISALEKCSAAHDNDGGGGNDNNSDDDGQCRLGFNYCLTCGASLTTTKRSHQTTATTADTTTADAASASTTERAKKIITCKGCNRVNYCSELCRRIDAEPQQQQQHGTNGDDNEEGGVDENALGHSPVICSLLNLCNDDELVEDELYDNGSNSDSKLKNDNNNNQKYEIAKYRIQTERESYPATLFNMLSDDGPSWLVEALSRRLRYKEEIRSPEGKLFHRSTGGSGSGEGGGGGDERKKRRGKRDRQSFTSSDEITTPTTPTTTPSSSSSKGNKKELVLHIVGAQSDSELWGWDGSSSSINNNKNEMLDAYAEASSNVLSYLQNFIDVITGIRLVFVGPGCPQQQKRGNNDEKKKKRTVFHCEKMIPGSKTMLYVETHCCNYGDEGGSNNNNNNNDNDAIPPPDTIIFFNPGFSCTDYDWSTALKAAASSSSLHGSALSSTPFLVTTNTEMEGYADIKCLVDGGYVDSKDIPNDILETFSDDEPSLNDKKYSSHNDDDEQEKKFFFCENPYAGLRVRQSGTMANDLYVKSRWVMGGLFVPENKKMVATKLVNKSKSKKKRRKDSEERRSSSDVHRKKKRRKGDGSNPALI